MNPDRNQFNEFLPYHDASNMSNQPLNNFHQLPIGSNSSNMLNQAMNRSFMPSNQNLNQNFLSSYQSSSSNSNIVNNQLPIGTKSYSNPSIANLLPAAQLNYMAFNSFNQSSDDFPQSPLTANRNMFDITNNVLNSAFDTSLTDYYQQNQFNQNFASASLQALTQMTNLASQLNLLSPNQAVTSSSAENLNSTSDQSDSKAHSSTGSVDSNDESNTSNAQSGQSIKYIVCTYPTVLQAVLKSLILQEADFTICTSSKPNEIALDQKKNRPSVRFSDEIETFDISSDEQKSAGAIGGRSVHTPVGVDENEFQKNLDSEDPYDREFLLNVLVEKMEHTYSEVINNLPPDKREEVIAKIKANERQCMIERQKYEQYKKEKLAKAISYKYNINVPTAANLNKTSTNGNTNSINSNSVASTSTMNSNCFENNANNNNATSRIATSIYAVNSNATNVNATSIRATSRNAINVNATSNAASINSANNRATSRTINNGDNSFRNQACGGNNVTRTNVPQGRPMKKFIGPKKLKPVPMTENICFFCKNNGEPDYLYKTHIVRDPVTNKTLCPVLRNYKCEICGASGDDSHTRSYCPYSGMVRQSTVIGNAQVTKYVPIRLPLDKIPEPISETEDDLVDTSVEDRIKFLNSYRQYEKDSKDPSFKLDNWDDPIDEQVPTTSTREANNKSDVKSTSN